MSEFEQLTESIHKLIEAMQENRPLGETMDTHDVARFFKVSYSTARDKIITRPDFPKPIRSTITDNPRKVFFTTDVVRFAKLNQK